MKKKNEIFRWIIVAICGFEIFRLTKTFLSSITTYKQVLETGSMQNETVKTIKFATPIQFVGITLLILSFLAVIYYFVFCFGKKEKAKLLGGTVLFQSVCMILLLIHGILMNYNLFVESIEIGGIYYLLSDVLSYTNYFVTCVVYLVVAIAIFKNIQNNKSIKITCIVLTVFYIVLSLLHVFSICMFYTSFENSSSIFITTFFKNFDFLGVFIDLYILFYIFFMDKDYKLEK